MLQILFIEHREQKQLFVLHMIVCKNIFSATELWNCLFSLKNNQYLKKKSLNEFLIQEKVEKHAIIKYITVESLLNHNLNIIVLKLSNLKNWKQKDKWYSEFTNLYLLYYKVLDKLLDAAVALTFKFAMENKSVIVKMFLDSDYCIHSKELNNDQVLDRIKKQTLFALTKFMSNLSQATEKLNKTFNKVIEAFS